jgi:putative acyl-CoA dehydrogenase
MTFAGVHLMRQCPELAKDWESKLVAFKYDPNLAPIHQKQSALVGMAMTEKQGGSDLRAIQTTAEPRQGNWYSLEGHKWFCSAPMSDGFFTLAKTENGPTCFFAPRVSPEGTRNRILFQRLKDKCGNRSNASSEIEYDGAWAHLIGEPGRGIATLIEMAHLTRFDICMSVVGIMRYALRHALHHANNRNAFGKRLADQALMKSVLADMQLEWEASMYLSFRLAMAFDSSVTSGAEKALARLLTPIAKYWLCKRLPGFVAEAMEVMGGNGFIEEGPLARVYREAPLNGIWEGSGNVICIDVLRAIKRDRQSLSVLLEYVQTRLQDEDTARKAIHRVMQIVTDSEDAERYARQLTELLAILFQAALMREYSTALRADSFVRSRLQRGCTQYGALDLIPDFSDLRSS